MKPANSTGAMNTRAKSLSLAASSTSSAAASTSSSLAANQPAAQSDVNKDHLERVERIEREMYALMGENKKLQESLAKISSMYETVSHENTVLKGSLTVLKQQVDAVSPKPRRKVPKSKSVSNINNANQYSILSLSEDEDSRMDEEFPSLVSNMSASTSSVNAACNRQQQLQQQRQQQRQQQHQQRRTSSMASIDSSTATIAAATVVNNTNSNSGASRNVSGNGRHATITAGQSVNSNTKHINSNNNSVNANASNKKKVIQAANSTIFAVRRNLVAANVTNFSVKQAKLGGPVKVTLGNQQDTDLAKKALSGAGVSYHEFLNSNEKRKCFIIRGLVGATYDDLPFIKEELIDAGLPEAIEVQLHETGFIKANSNSVNTPVKLILPPNVDLKILDGIHHLNHIVVKFEQFHSKSIVQCKNCQRFGHSAAGCQHQHRCVKCGANHYRADCPRTHDQSVKLFCCNCGGDHTANNLLVCQYFLQNYANKPSPKKSPMVPATRGPSVPARRVTRQLSFAQAAKSSLGHSSSPPGVATSSPSTSIPSFASPSASSSPGARQQQQHQQQQRHQQQRRSSTTITTPSSFGPSAFDALQMQNIELRFRNIESNSNNLSSKVDQLISIVTHLTNALNIPINNV